MKAVFPNSAWVRAQERLILSGGRMKSLRLKVRYGIVLHPNHGPVLIDTGYTEHATSHSGRGAMLRLYSRVLSPELNPSEQPLAVLQDLGFSAEDVKFVIITHFHADHVSGLQDFPKARFVVDAEAWAHVKNSSVAGNLRHGVFTELLPDDFDARVIPLSSCPLTAQGRDVFKDESVIAIPLPGHATGHFGLWMNTTPRPVLYAVDAQWLRIAAVQDRAPGFPARLIMDDAAAFNRSSQWVAQQIAQGQEVVFCHDPQDGPWDWTGAEL